METLPYKIIYLTIFIFMFPRFANCASYNELFNFDLEDTPLKLINENMETYSKNIDLIKNNLNIVKGIFKKNKLFILNKFEIFKVKVFNESSILFQNGELRTERKCDRYGNCRDVPVFAECSQHLIKPADKGSYEESLRLFSESLLNNYDNKINLLQENLETIATKVIVYKTYAYIYYNQQKLLKTDNLDELMKTYWEQEILSPLNEYVTNILGNAKEIVDSYEELIKLENEFENSIMEDIYSKKLEYACCLKRFNVDSSVISCYNLRFPIHPPLKIGNEDDLSN